MPNLRIYNDIEVIPLLKAGEESAFHYIYEKFQPTLFYLAYRLLDNQAEAEDVTAESFVKLWNARSSFDNISSIGSWLKVTTKNASLDILKHRKTVAEKNIRLFEAAKAEDDEWTNEDLFAEALQEIYKQIELLPPKSREIFKQRYIYGLKNEEIAKKMAINNQSVRDHLSRALKILRAEILKKENLFSLFLLFLNTK